MYLNAQVCHCLRIAYAVKVRYGTSCRTHSSNILMHGHEEFCRQKVVLWVPACDIPFLTDSRTIPTHYELLDKVGKYYE
jgi:hypothetical protein